MPTKINTTWHEVLPQIIPLVHRILLYGPPDTGKTTAATRLGDANGGSIRLQCSRQQGVEDLLGSFVLRNGATEFVPGPIPRAMREGRILVIDEFDQRNAAHDSIYHAALDDKDIACIALPDGTECRPTEGYKVICTTNAGVGAFSPALQRRFEVKLWCGQAHPEALKTLAPECAAMLKNWQLSVQAPETKVETSVSSLRVYGKLAKAFGMDQAAALVFPSTHQEFLSTLASNLPAK